MLETVPREEDLNWRRVGKVQPTPARAWCTGQSGAPPDNSCSCPVHDFFPYGEQSIVATSDLLAHRTVRCPLPTIGATTCRAKIVRLTVGAGDRWLTGQSGAPPDNSCSNLVRDLLPYRAQPTVGPPWPLAHWTQSGVPNRPLARTTCRALIARTTVGCWYC